MIRTSGRRGTAGAADVVRRFVISKIVVNRFAEIDAACCGQLICWQIDDKTRRTLSRNLFGRADDVFFSILVEITLMKGGGIERVEQLTQSAEADLYLCLRQ